MDTAAVGDRDGRAGGRARSGRRRRAPGRPAGRTGGRTGGRGGTGPSVPDRIRALPAQAGRTGRLGAPGGRTGRRGRLRRGVPPRPPARGRGAGDGPRPGRAAGIGEQDTRAGPAPRLDVCAAPVGRRDRRGRARLPASRRRAVGVRLVPPVRCVRPPHTGVPPAVPPQAGSPGRGAGQEPARMPDLRGGGRFPSPLAPAGRRRGRDRASGGGPGCTAGRARRIPRDGRSHGRCPRPGVRQPRRRRGPGAVRALAEAVGPRSAGGLPGALRHEAGLSGPFAPRASDAARPVQPRPLRGGEPHVQRGERFVELGDRADADDG
ncbi:hypothetical protein GA0115239_101310 [Streptomyces sp. BpilaLS-43]|nr:hypothetical protein GA0115239_101310 [Streptomyces sp. BpilaLS-43]